jgi:hypothetical protein
MFEWIHDLPLYCATILTVILFAAIILWAVTRPKDYIYSEAPDRKLWRDLRVWATLIMVIQIAIYMYVGFALTP